MLVGGGSTVGGRGQSYKWEGQSCGLEEALMWVADGQRLHCSEITF